MELLVQMAFIQEIDSETEFNVQEAYWGKHF